MRYALLALKLKISNFLTEEEGQDLIEYALLCTLITLALILSISGVANGIMNVFDTVSSDL